MSESCKKPLHSICQIGVLFGAVFTTTYVFADEPSSSDSSPPNSLPTALPGESETTSPPPSQEPWHVFPSGEKTSSASSEEPRYHSNAQRIAGGILMGLGAASLVGSVVLIGVAGSGYSKNAEGNGLAILFVGLPVLVGGIACEVVGISLYINGSKPADRQATRAHVPPPVALSVRMGPQSAALKLTF